MPGSVEGRRAATVAAAIVLACMLTAAAGCSRDQEETDVSQGPKRQEEAMGTKTLEGKSVLMIIARQRFREEELAEPRAVLEGAGAELTIASSAIGDCVGMPGGMRVRAEATIDKVDPAGYDAVVFVGGPGASEYFDSPTAHRIAVEAHEAGKLVCAICIAPATLANAGLLRGKKATAYPSVKDQLVSGGADYTGAGVEVDGLIITADGPGSATRFGEAIRDALAAE